MYVSLLSPAETNPMVMTKINKYWLIWSRPSKDRNLMIRSHYNEDILKAMKRFTIIQLILLVVYLVVPRFVLIEELQIPLVMFVYIIVSVIMLYNVLRCYFYQIMIKVREELQ